MNIEKKAITRVPIDKTIANRWSGRAFDPARIVEKERILALLEAARWAPSCYGDEPWRFIVCDRHTCEDDWASALACLTEGNREWASSAPLLILAVAASRFRKNEKSNRWAMYDTGAASVSLCLQAVTIGLMCHQMGGFDVDRSRSEFSIPADYQPMAMIAVGYQLDREQIPANLVERELAARKRSDIGANFFAGRWNKGYT